MSERPKETSKVHTRLLKCALEIDGARAYWSYTDGSAPVVLQKAFNEYWFGARSLDRVKTLLANFRYRFNTYPQSLHILHHWPMTPDIRRIICHWHLQLADPLYRAFTGNFLAERREGSRKEVTRDVVVTWVSSPETAHWQMSTRIRFASALLSCAFSAGLVGATRGSRPLLLPRIDDNALVYILYLLREIKFKGTLLDNPYLRSLGLAGKILEDRLHSLEALDFRRQSDLIDYGWTYSSLINWAKANIIPSGLHTGGTTK